MELLLSISIYMGITVAGAVGLIFLLWWLYRRHTQTKLKQAQLNTIIANGKAKSEAIDSMVDDVGAAARELCKQYRNSETDEMREALQALLQTHDSVYAQWASAVATSSQKEESESIELLQATIKLFLQYEPTIGALQAQVYEFTRASEECPKRFETLEHDHEVLRETARAADKRVYDVEALQEQIEDIAPHLQFARERMSYRLFLSATEALDKVEQSLQEATLAAKSIGIIS